jgi:hypothetical protein
MITVRQSLQQLGLLPNEADETVLYVRLNVLLRDPTIGLMGIVTEAVRFVTTAVVARDSARYIHMCALYITYIKYVMYKYIHISIISYKHKGLARYIHICAIFITYIKYVIYK